MLRYINTSNTAREEVNKEPRRKAMIYHVCKNAGNLKAKSEVPRDQNEKKERRNKEVI